MLIRKIKTTICIIVLFLSILTAETIGRVMKANGEVFIKPIGGASY